MRYLLFILPALFILYSCDNPNPNVDTTLKMPSHYECISIHKDQIKYWLKNEKPIKDTDSNLVYEYWDGRTRSIQVEYTLDSNKVKLVSRNKIYPKGLHGDFLNQFKDWRVELRRDDFVEKGKELSFKYENTYLRSQKMVQENKQYEALLMYTWDEYKEEGTAVLIFTKSDQ